MNPEHQIPLGGLAEPAKRYGGRAGTPPGADVPAADNAPQVAAHPARRGGGAPSHAPPPSRPASPCADRPPPHCGKRLAPCPAGDGRLGASGGELYAWPRDGAPRSRLWARLAGPALGVKATARNWTTVTRLLALADGS